MRPADELLRRRDVVLGGRGKDVKAGVAKGGRPVELIEARTSHSKTFEVAPGVRHLSQSVSPVHYDTGGGTLEEIDTTFLPGDRPGVAFVVESAPYRAEILQGTIGWRHTSRQGGWLQMELAAVDGQPVASVPTPRAEGDQVVWDQVVPGVDIKITAFPASSEAFKQFDGPHELEWKVTQSKEQFWGRLQERLAGWDRTGDRLEIITSRQGAVFKERWTGRVSKIVDPRTRRKEWVDHPADGGPVIVDAAITEKIATGPDDVWEAVGGDLFTDGVTWRAGVTLYGIGQWYGGLRFTSVAIPPGVQVQTASLTLNVTSVTNSAALRIWGVATDDAAPWSVSSKPSDRTRTGTSASFVPGVLGSKVVDVTNLVTEILGRPGWASGNDLALVVEGSTGYIEVEAYEAAGDQQAQLDVTFVDPGQEIASSDTGTLVETASIGLAVGDSGSLVEVAAVAVATAAADTGSLVETSGLEVLTGDSGSLVETATVDTALTAAETGTLTDSAALAPDVAAAETGNLAETSTVAAAAAAAEVGSLVEHPPQIALSAAEVGTLVETSEVDEIIGPVTSDSGTMVETATVGAALSAAEVGTLVETSAVAVLKYAAEMGSLVETSQVEVLASETGTLVETATVAATLTASESGSLAEAAYTVRPLSAAEVGTLVETATVTVLGRDITGVGRPYVDWRASTPYI